ncbi:MAG: tRNA lysidine(34) synthetase TilS [Verrucomicrobia bacterium]|jgi:tRNA(Ile)-lysidine synthase|nr:tRNA lysidine(34) synthetase TilS [Verrucomicrobiota bacterium]
MNLPELIKKQITSQGMLRRGERAVVAVSGGVDSMVLLHLLHSWATGMGWGLSVAHFNHQLRGRSSDADERLVRATADRLGLACDVGRADVRQCARRRKVSVEMAARDLRHAFLARCASKRKAAVVVLAQHADDQVEHFLMRLMRGAGGAGLRGMAGQSFSPADRGIRLVRPLLALPKAEVLAFARLQRIGFRQDASNEAVEFDRNWVRHKLLPLLRCRQPAIERTVLRSLGIVEAETDYARRSALEWLAEIRRGRRVRPTAFEQLHPAVQRHVIQEQLIELGCEPGFDLVEHLRNEPGRSVTVAARKAVARERSGVVRVAAAQIAKFAGGQRVIRIVPTRQTRGCVEFGGVVVNWRVLRKPAGFSMKLERNVEYFDAERVGARLLLRHWRPGDRFRPIGLTAATKLQDWFTNRKVPRTRRRELVLAETERGDIFWVEGERIAEVCKVTPKTRRLLELRCKRS